MLINRLFLALLIILSCNHLMDYYRFFVIMMYSSKQNKLRFRDILNSLCLTITYIRNICPFT